MELVRDIRAQGVDAEFLLWSGSAADGITEAAASEAAELHRRGYPRATGRSPGAAGVGVRAPHPDQPAAGHGRASGCCGCA